MTVFRWRDPFYEQFKGFRELSRIQDEVNRLYESLFGRGPMGARAGVFPAINISEDAENLYLSAELPGVESADMDITVEEESLIIKGSRKIPPEGEEVSYHRREREGGDFNRKISLPTRIDPEAVSAETMDGILKIVMPKAAEVKPRTIEINVQ